jgi:hypothetical protein
LFIQGNRVDVEGRDTGAVDRPTYRFRDMLPAVAQTVEMRVIRGRGRVVIAEQPSAANQYATVVNIRNNNRPEWYSLEFFWADDNAIVSQNRRAGRARDYGTRARTADRVSDGPGQVTWTGDVDNEVFVVFTGRRAITTAVRGRDVGGARTDFSAPMPRRAQVSVNLSDVRCRGQVELMEQPSSENSYAAKVRIVDPQAGIGTYSFTLNWDGDSLSSDYDRQSGVLSPAGVGAGDPTLRWSGRVDGTIRVSARAGRMWSERVSGGPISEERSSVVTPVPRRNGYAEIRKISGRGEIAIVQQPSSANDYTLVFQITDDSGGADFYDLEVTWR